MTTLDAALKLYEWFAENDSFNFKINFKNLPVVSDEPFVTKATFQTALDEMEKAGYLSKTILNNDEYWILKKPLAAMDQTLSLNGTLCGAIASVINSACEQLKDTKNICNPLNLKEGDIEFLMFLLNLKYKDQENSID